MKLHDFFENSKANKQFPNAKTLTAKVLTLLLEVLTEKPVNNLKDIVDDFYYTINDDNDYDLEHIHHTYIKLKHIIETIEDEISQYQIIIKKAEEVYTKKLEDEITNLYDQLEDEISQYIQLEDEISQYNFYTLIYLFYYLFKQKIVDTKIINIIDKLIKYINYSKEAWITSDKITQIEKDITESSKPQ